MAKVSSTNCIIDYTICDISILWKVSVSGTNTLGLLAEHVLIPHFVIR